MSLSHSHTRFLSFLPFPLPINQSIYLSIYLPCYLLRSGHFSFYQTPPGGRRLASFVSSQELHKFFLMLAVIGRQRQGLTLTSAPVAILI